MIITKTRIYERFFIELYEKSKCEDFKITEKLTAREIVFQFKSIVKLIDIVEETCHGKNVEKLYFNFKNSCGYCITSIADELFLCERTLQRYRNKYAKLMEILLQYYKVDVLLDKYCPVTD